MSWSFFIVVTVMAMQICTGEKSCEIWSSVGPVIQLGHSFRVYCYFSKYKCKVSMKDHPSSEQQPSKLNSTTLYFNVFNITMNKTYSCECKDNPALDSCGLDISTGYPPDPPRLVSCIYKIHDIQSGVVVCQWDGGRDTILQSSSELWVAVSAGENSEGPESYAASKGTESLSASFTAPRSVKRISVWVQAQNKLARVNSSIFNYNLSDIAMPSTPALGQPRCFSQMCSVRVEQSMRTEHLEIQYKLDRETWKTHRPNSVLHNNSSHIWNISSLQPFRLYHFRARSKFSSGLWSPWSMNTSSWTQEEAPAKELDVWFTESESDIKSVRIYWKEANISVSRGKIVEYRVEVGANSSHASLSADARNYLVSRCENCEVRVWARNSKGTSPAAKIMTQRTSGNPPQDVQVTQSSSNVAISWRRPGTAPSPTGYVVEWFPQGRRLEELRWVRLGRGDNHTLITDMRPFECYEGAVYDLHEDSSGTGTRFKDVSISESAPASGPVIQEKVEGNKVKVTWTELPRNQRGGCITKYTFYLESNSGILKTFSVPASERTRVIDGLSPGDYNLWMSASTAKGEGPKSQKAELFIEKETPLSSLLVCVVAATMLLLLLCLCQSSTVKQRFLEIFQCIMLDVVPDPANSKWAKECSQGKGQINLQLQLSSSSGMEEEEEPILVDVEELPRQSDQTSALKIISSQLRHETSLSPDAEPATLLYPLTTYIKSLSQDSDSSDLTHTSMDTSTTVDYISSHGPGDLDEEGEDEEEEEDEEEFVGTNFFTSQNIFAEPLAFGGKLTLDAVKIDCSNFFQSLDI